MDKVIKRFKNMMNVSMLMSIVDVVVGLLFIFCTSFTSKINIVILGVLIVIHGLFYVIRYVYDGLGNSIFRFDVIFGIVAIILGVFTVFNPFSVMKVIGIFFGIWLLISGGEKLLYVIKLGKAYDEIFPLTTFICVLLVIMGGLAIFNPFETFMLITRLIGFFLICDAVFEFMFWRLFKHRAKEVLSLFK